ncbi:hypothetical protein [Isoptericola cucumis]|uniref:Ceramidase n=1 Tax=Isoptericola cucumis TaxID=1776856 RepID=A0ABQ2B120_9MICO|nr:hypothetical protein [Isoptericola cucumis]GGI05309.1 hypothetical protein GCM10007368_05510 [Isoptericola cucumis]
MAGSPDVWSSLAFVVAGAWIVATARAGGAAPDTEPGTVRARACLGVLAVLVGVGSVVQHGPAPSWNPVVHDPPLLGTYALIAADAVADLTSRRMRAWWWLAPTAADVVLAAVWPVASVVAQGTTAAVAVVAVLLRARARPALRPRLLGALAVLGVGSVVAELSRPDRPWSGTGPGARLDEAVLGSPPLGHAAWHVLAAAAIVVVAPTVGRRPGRRDDRRLSGQDAGTDAPPAGGRPA